MQPENIQRRLQIERNSHAATETLLCRVDLQLEFVVRWDYGVAKLALRYSGGRNQTSGREYESNEAEQWLV